MEIGGEVAIVTGASSGVGKRVAGRLAEAGARLVLLGRDVARLEATALACRAAGAEAQCIAGDIGDEAHVQAAFAVAGVLGPVGILVNAAGISLPRRMKVEEISAERWDEMIRVNLRGSFLTCARAIGPMKARRRGVIVNIGSTAAHVAQPGVSAYASTKFGLRALTESMIGECAGSDVRVALVSSGPVATPIWDKADAPPALPFEAMAQPDDIADAVLWLIGRPERIRIDEILIRPSRPV
jgi:NADP-dependent 3-hydroxy acid dehydrogenase YdfG